MAGDVSLELWLHEYKADALEQVCKENGSDLETVMQNRLNNLYTALVPSETRAEIQQRIESENRIRQMEQEASSTFAVYHVRENAGEEYFRTKKFSDLLGAARVLRRHLRDEDAAKTKPFASRFPNRQTISAGEFEQYVLERMDNTGRIEGAYELDFDKMEFSGVNIMDGWQTFAMHDVSTAVYHADRSPYAHPKERLEILLDKLDGRQITSAGHLSARELFFEDEICEIDDRLNFYLRSGFDVDAVFGTFVVTDQNDDTLNIYANYDMADSKVCDTLDIILHRGDGSEEELSYDLNAAEKEILHRKMEVYCQEQTGMTLVDYSAQRMAENEAPLTEPQM